MAPSSRSSRPIRSSRTQVQSYHEESSSEGRDDEDTQSDEERARRLSLSLRPRNSARMPKSYREESTDDDFDATNDEPEAVVPTIDAPEHLTYPFTETNSRSAPSRAPRNRTMKTRSQTKNVEKRTGRRRIELGRPLKKRRKVEEDNTPIVTSGVIPPWQTLPYHILFDIFSCAASPLMDEKTASRHSSVQWLVNIALMCHAFHEPALAALSIIVLPSCQQLRPMLCYSYWLSPKTLFPLTTLARSKNCMLTLRVFYSTRADRLWDILSCQG